MENSYYGDVSPDVYDGDPFIGAPSRATAKMRGSSRVKFLDVLQGKVTSTTLPSADAGFAAARLEYFMQRMADYAPYRTTVFTAVPNGSGVATITINTADLQTDTAYLNLTKFVPLLYFTFGASPTSAVPASQSSITISAYDTANNLVSNNFAIERNTAQMTKVRYANYRLLFGKPVADDILLSPTASAQPLILSVTGLVGNANFSVEVPGFNDPRLAAAYASLNA